MSLTYYYIFILTQQRVSYLINMFVDDLFLQAAIGLYIESLKHENRY